jgi:plastocyanin
MKLKALAVLALAALSLVLVACGGDSDDSTGGDATATVEETTESGGASGGSTAEDVEIVEFAYQPEPVVVEVGGAVTWTNEDTAPHTATADDGSFETETLAKGKSEAISFDEAGTFPYFCAIHPTMHGTVEVVE